MDTEMKKLIVATDKEAQYDASAKRLLSHKQILAHILVKTVKEFADMEIADIIELIEGEPHISQVPVDAGLSNHKDGSIVGLNSESTEINEGMIRYDIIFYVRLRDETSQIIINIEAQKSEPREYDILDRGIFYVSRMLSSQKGRDFINNHYNDIKQVYSIWICMNLSEDCMDHIHLTTDKLLGSHRWKGRLGLFNLVMIGLGKDIARREEKYELHRLLGALLSQNLEINEKLDILSTEYNIPLEGELREEVNVMCNLSQAIKEEGISIGEARGEARGISIGEARGISIGEARGISIGEERGMNMSESRIILNMNQNGFTIEQIMTAVGKTREEIENIIKREED